MLLPSSDFGLRYKKNEWKISTEYYYSTSMWWRRELMTFEHCSVSSRSVETFGHQGIVMLRWIHALLEVLKVFIARRTGGKRRQGWRRAMNSSVSSILRSIFSDFNNLAQWTQATAQATQDALANANVQQLGQGDARQEGTDSHQYQGDDEVIETGLCQKWKKNICIFVWNTGIDTYPGYQDGELLPFLFGAIQMVFFLSLCICRLDQIQFQWFIRKSLSRTEGKSPWKTKFSTFKWNVLYSFLFVRSNNSNWFQFNFE